ncbi:alpha/beta fold hydrolase [Sulfitobacter albidus]|uniref:Alpha/beta fold hydrolase n=1 Tax=Sulfitobacter albidus TaxID=2829501 RepID=A0A975JDF2_9RHOB|nr:alpha/beta fold hydrolase [Sulfitobacter albidus]QUJ76426.1 alpha/beta fold hydrolase [Sulfitobacter albidus]
MAQAGVTALLLICLLCAGGGWPFYTEHRRTVMTDGHRGAAPGKFAELSQGVTHYHFSGPVDGPLVVLVHGLTTPSFVWTPIARALAARGFRVLAYDLYGRGFSDRPHGPQDKAFFLTQLDDLLAHLGIEKSFCLIGYSMGGAIAAGFAAAAPQLVERLILIAPAGMGLPDSRTLSFIRDRGFLGVWAMLALYPRQFRQGIRAEAGQPSAVPDIAELQLGQLDYRGFVPAVLASLRGILARPLEGEHLALKNEALPILAIWGEDDDVIPASAMGTLAAWNRAVRHEVIADAAHGLPYTHSAQVIDHITRFLPLPPPRD